MSNNSIRSLDDVFNDPEAKTLLASQHKTRPVTYDPDVEKFKTVQAWIKEKGHEPEKTRDPSRLQERRYASFLKGIRDDKDRQKLLKPYDKLGILESADKESVSLQDAVKHEKKNFTSLDDILNDDSILFESKKMNSKLFDTKKLNQVKKQQENKPEVISKRKHMDDFNGYAPLFKKVQAEIASGMRQLRPFKNNQIQEHAFYVLNGQLLYIESIGEEYKNSNRSREETDARVHVIYENGTENYPLRNGLIASLYGSKKRGGNGKTVTEPDENFKLTDDDYVTGYIYVLESLSDNPDILRIRKRNPLYKVGFTSGSVEKRIANAENESTYLYGPVRLCEKVKVVNLDAEALETTLHHALKNYQLDVSITAPNGHEIRPREWFVVDLDEINKLINEIVARLKLM